MQAGQCREAEVGPKGSQGARPPAELRCAAHTPSTRCGDADDEAELKRSLLVCLHAFGTVTDAADPIWADLTLREAAALVVDECRRRDDAPPPLPAGAACPTADMIRRWECVVQPPLTPATAAECMQKPPSGLGDHGGSPGADVGRLVPAQMWADAFAALLSTARRLVGASEGASEIDRSTDGIATRAGSVGWSDEEGSTSDGGARTRKRNRAKGPKGTKSKKAKKGGKEEGTGRRKKKGTDEGRTKGDEKKKKKKSSAKRRKKYAHAGADVAVGAESSGSAHSELSFGAMPTSEYWRRVPDVSASGSEQRVWEARSVRGVDINAHRQR